MKDSVLSRQVRSDSFNKNMGNDLSCLKCEGDRKETDPPLGKYCILLNDCIRNNLDFTEKNWCTNSALKPLYNEKVFIDPLEIHILLGT